MKLRNDVLFQALDNRCISLILTMHATRDLIFFAKNLSVVLEVRNVALQGYSLHLLTVHKEMTAVCACEGSHCCVGLYLREYVEYSWPSI